MLFSLLLFYSWILLPKFWSYQGENFYTLTSFFLVSSCLRVSLSSPKQHLRVYFKKHNFLKHGRHEGTSLWPSFKGIYFRSTVRWQPPAANLCLRCDSQWLDTVRQYTRVSQCSCLTGASLRGSHGTLLRDSPLTWLSCLRTVLQSQVQSINSPSWSPFHRHQIFSTIWRLSLPTLSNLPTPLYPSPLSPK